VAAALHRERLEDRMPTRGARGCGGFTLIEVLIASALTAAVAIGVVQLVAIGSAAERMARDGTLATALAVSKLEELRSLVWAYEPGSDPPAPRSDAATDLSRDPAAPGGPGLAASPAGTLVSNVPPYVDYLDGRGVWVGNGAALPPRAAFVRRWSVQPLPADPGATMILSVLVSPVAQDRSRRAAWRARSGAEALLVTLQTRKGRQ
jgi:prepilin-type N-terminal cleavage/methylation domain-containing protein